MVKTARVPGPILEINRRNVRALDDLDRVKFGLPPESATARERLRNVVEGVQDPVLNPTNLLEIATKFGANPARVEKLSKSIETSGLPLPIVPCELLHACGNHGCVRHNVWLFNQVFWEISRVYGVLNVVPVLIFGRRRLMKEPLGVAKRLLASTARSSAFLAVYVTSYMVMACLTRNLQGIHLLTRDHKTLYYLFGIVSGCAIFVERDGRRGELAAYVLPKAAESAWRVWADRGYLPKWVRGGDFGMFAVGLGLLMVGLPWVLGVKAILLMAAIRRGSTKLLQAISAHCCMPSCDVLLLEADRTEMDADFLSWESCNLC